MSLTLAVLSDIHEGDPPLPQRRGQFGTHLLRRAVERFNRWIKPDLVLVLGDLIDDPQADDAREKLHALRAVLDRLQCPFLVIPGNHDPAADLFYSVFDRPGEVEDFAGRLRVLPFLDPEEPGYHARRTPDDLQRLRAARRDAFDGFVIAAQHVSVRPPGREMAHTFTNLDEVLTAVEAGRVNLCLGGHSHTAAEPVQHNGCCFYAGGALCESPHHYALVHIDDRNHARVVTHQLAMPDEYQLVDYHSHTQYAYCAQNVHTSQSPEFARMMNLRALALTEHSGQLYFNQHDFGSGAFCHSGIESANPEHSRADDYIHTVQPLRADDLHLGMEIDADFQGRPVIRDEHARLLDVRIGAVHFIPEGLKPHEQRDAEAYVDQFKHITEGICQSNIHILAHPFRAFRRSQMSVPESLYPWLVKVLRDNDVAAELNYHTNEPHPAFVKMCIESGVKLSFGGDAHEIWEIGEFHPHLSLLESLGCHGDPTPLMIDPQPQTART